MMSKATPSTSSIPSLRDPTSVWKTAAALLYAVVTISLGFAWMLPGDSRSPAKLILAILLAAHGRVIASYLVHECAHSSIFVNPWANERLGTICLWLAGCPYADFDHVKLMHWHHHKDRADPFEWNIHPFFEQFPHFQKPFVLLEWAFIPAVETVMHFRTALYPIFRGHECTPCRCRSAWIGTIFQTALYVYLVRRGALLPHLLAGGLVLQFLALQDAFHHTFEAFQISEHKPGPNGRTAQYEEENTYSNLWSERFTWLNLLSLNFGYHNAHHKKPMVPWYALPDLHDKLYHKHGGTDTATPSQILPMRDLFYSWFAHRLRRVTEEEYGVVHPTGTPDRARDFIGALGVSFLTV